MFEENQVILKQIWQLLVVIDVFSRRLIVRKLKNKEATTVRDAFKDILKTERKNIRKEDYINQIRPWFGIC